MYCGFGRVWATIDAPGNCIWPRSIFWPSIRVPFRAILTPIRALPGVGRYTAGAIGSIACGIRAPILEANTVRLYSRLLAFREDTSCKEGQQLLWDFAEALLPRTNAGDVNQALMELGSLVCTPRNPRCEACPVSSLCPTFAAGLQDEIPVAKKKVRFEAVREAAIVVRRVNKVLLRQRPHGERWAGLWDFVRFPILATTGKELTTEIAQEDLRANRHSSPARQAHRNDEARSYPLPNYLRLLQCHSYFRQRQKTRRSKVGLDSSKRFGELPSEHHRPQIGRLYCKRRHNQVIS